jgi:hypothetical protein
MGNEVRIHALIGGLRCLGPGITDNVLYSRRAPDATSGGAPDASGVLRAARSLRRASPAAESGAPDSADFSESSDASGDFEKSADASGVSFSSHRALPLRLAPPDAPDARQKPLDNPNHNWDQTVLFTRSIASREGATPRRERAQTGATGPETAGKGGNQDC